MLSALRVSLAASQARPTARRPARSPLRLLDVTPVPCGQSAVTAKRPDLFGWVGFGYWPSHSRWHGGAELMLICTCEGTVTGFGLANPKLYGERDQARQMLSDRPASPPGTGHRRDHR
jgi:hypothetical protein